MIPDPVKGARPSYRANSGPVKGQKEKKVSVPSSPENTAMAIKNLTTSKAAKELTKNHKWSKGSNDLNGYKPNFFNLKI
jgi:hypothetical protein